MRAVELGSERSAERSSRQYSGIADPAPGVDYEHRNTLAKRRVLETIVHDDDRSTGGEGRPCSAHAVARNDRRRDAREQKRLVADLKSAMPLGIDLERIPLSPTIAAAQEDRTFSCRLEHTRHRNRERGLARTADDRAADAQDRRGHALALARQAMGRDGALDRGQG